jgi:hypothetical protein
VLFALGSSGTLGKVNRVGHEESSGGNRRWEFLCSLQRRRLDAFGPLGAIELAQFFEFGARLGEFFLQSRKVFLQVQKLAAEREIGAGEIAIFLPQASESIFINHHGPLLARFTELPAFR